MHPDDEEFLRDHVRLTRRWLIGLGVGATVWGRFANPSIADDPSEPKRDQLVTESIAKLESYLTKPDDFRDVSRGKPLPHRLTDEKKAEVGMTRESWRLEIISDPEKPAKLGKQFTKEADTAITFDQLMKLAERHAVRFPKVMTCLNIGCPLGMGLWEGVPMRELLWMTEPQEDLRRVFYYGYHNDDPQQMFRSSLPVSRVLEDPFDLPPVILCYKLNGQWLSSERGGPVRVVVPEHYGFKSIKWLTTIVVSNLEHANDTYANGNNDLDSPLKSFSATLNSPTEVQRGQPFAVSGYAQVGIAGVRKVQVALENVDMPVPESDRYYTTLNWHDAEILGPPDNWGGDLPENAIPPNTFGFEAGKPQTWPMRLCKIHWAVLMPGAATSGKYKLRSRTIDEHGHAQPMPRPFRKSGHAAIESIPLTVV